VTYYHHGLAEVHDLLVLENKVYAAALMFT